MIKTPKRLKSSQGQSPLTIKTPEKKKDKRQGKSPKEESQEGSTEETPEGESKDGQVTADVLAKIILTVCDIKDRLRGLQIKDRHLLIAETLLSNLQQCSIRCSTARLVSMAFAI